MITGSKTLTREHHNIVQMFLAVKQCSGYSDSGCSAQNSIQIKEHYWHIEIYSLAV
jgi:hypothetical protein